MTDLNLSGLKPLDMGSQQAPSDVVSAAPNVTGLDLSSLKPIGQNGTPEEAPSAPLASFGSMAKNFGAGLLSGLPNLETSLENLNPTAPVRHYLEEKGIIPTLPSVGDVVKKGMGYLGFDPDNPEQIAQPQNAPERIARMAGEGTVTGAVAPLGELSIARSALMGGLSGAGSQAAQEAVPEPYKPIAGLVGGLAGGAAGLGVAEIPSAVKGAAESARDYVSPLTQAGRERLAGKTLNSAATNPDEAISAIETANPEIVPGSKPTTFQLSGDMGLGQLERAVAARNPQSFQDLRGEQNAARLDALANMQAEGHPEAVADFFRSRMNELDDATQALHDTAEQAAREKVSGLGGGRAPESYGEDIRSAVAPQIENATNAARSATEGIGGGQPEVLGEQLRSSMQNRLDALKEQERGLWKAVDPDETLMAVATPLKRATKRIYGDMGPESAIGMAPVERQIADVISGYGATLPFQRLINLRSAVSQAMRDARSPLSPNMPAYGRLSQLRGAIEGTISDSVAQKAAQEQQAVAEGALQPQETTIQRWIRERNDILDAQAAVAKSGRNSGTGLGTGSSVSLGEIRAGRENVGQSRGVEGGSESQGPFLDEEAAGRLKAATQATAERKQTFGAKPVSQILQRPGETQPYAMAPGAVASSLWKTGPQGADAVRAALKASNSSPEAVEALRGIAASSLRAKIPDGILTSRIFNQWRAQHAPALQELEKAAPGTVSRLENAARASEGLRKFDGFNSETPTAALPEKYFSTGEKGFSSVNDLRGLIGKEKADKLIGDYAADSLRKAASRADGTLDPKKFEAWRKSHSGALRAIPETDAQFLDAAKASEHLASVATERKNLMEAYQKSAIGNVMKVDDPADVVRALGSLFNRNDSVKAFRQLATEASKNSEAMNGLRKGIVEYMQGKLISNTEAGTSGRDLIKSDQFQTFLGKNYTALRQVFDDNELKTMRAIAQDLKRANRSIASSKLPGGSNTAQDLASMKKYDLQPSLLSKILLHVIGYGAGAGTGLGGLAGVIGSHVLSGMRENGIHSVEELVRDAMLDPQLAKTLMMKAPKKVDTGSELSLANKLRQMAAVAAVASHPHVNNTSH